MKPAPNRHVQTSWTLCSSYFFSTVAAAHGSVQPAEQHASTRPERGARIERGDRIAALPQTHHHPPAAPAPSPPSPSHSPPQKEEEQKHPHFTPPPTCTGCSAASSALCHPAAPPLSTLLAPRERAISRCPPALAALRRSDSRAIKGNRELDSSNSRQGLPECRYSMNSITGINEYPPGYSCRFEDAGLHVLTSMNSVHSYYDV